MTKIVVFLGPTLPRAAAQEILEASYLPPASVGDVYSAARTRPGAIAIIDGYFDRVPAVWHKEVLWAMSRGVHVYGASSMGALRAAELEAFGMVGVGRVFEAYRDRILEDDDEVALRHAPSEFGYVAGSEAMVNMRATFGAARDEGVVCQTTHDQLVAIAKRTFYAERDYQRTVEQAEEQGAPPSECAAFRSWLPAGRRDVKRSDAIELLNRMAVDAANDRGPKRVAYPFHKTMLWEELRNTIESRPLADSPGVEVELDDDAIDELRLEGEVYQRERDRSIARMLAVELGFHLGADPPPLAQHLAATSVMDSHGLSSKESMHEWFDRQQVSPDGADRLIEDDARARIIRARYHALMPAYLRDHLRLTGRYGDLTRRAREKQDLLWRRGLHNPSVQRAGITEAGLWEWFFVTLLHRPLPADLAAAAQGFDFPSVDLMRRAALREFLYRKLAQPAADTIPAAGAAGAEI